MRKKMNSVNKDITLTYEFDELDLDFDYKVDLYECEYPITLAIEKQYENKLSNEGIIAIEVYLGELFEDCDLELKRELANFYYEQIKDHYYDDAREQFLNDYSYEIEMAKKEAEYFENERNRDRREL